MVKKELTIIFHIDNLLLAYVEPAIVTEYIKMLDSIYGSMDPLSMTRRKLYKYLDMTIEFGLKRGVAIG